MADADVARLPLDGAPPLPLAALSSLFGSISIACWIVVFSPQIATNFRRQSTEGLSQSVLLIWLVGDVFNIVGAVLQAVLPTMVVLAVYYTVADIVLLGQCFWYRSKSDPDLTVTTSDPNERQSLLHSDEEHQAHRTLTSILDRVEHLSPVVPLIEEPPYGRRHSHSSDHARRSHSFSYESISPPTIPPDEPPPSALRSFLINTSAILLVCAAGAVGWYLSQLYSPRPSDDAGLVPPDPPELSVWGQVFGYICAVLYLLSRLPQIILNYNRKSTDGVAILFFLFACMGNAMYVASILTYEVPCLQSDHGCRSGQAWHQYWQYVLVNLSWLAGSFGTLILDFIVLGQFFLYGDGVDDESDTETESSGSTGSAS